MIKFYCEFVQLLNLLKLAEIDDAKLFRQITRKYF